MKFIINDFDKLDMDAQEEIQDFVAGITPEFIIEEDKKIEIIYCDGAGYNGKISKYCIAKSYDSNRIYRENLNRTNNEMEYIAVIEALKDITEPTLIYTDSLLVVNQLKGTYAIKSENLKEYYFQAKNLLRKKPFVEVQWCPRGQNIAGKLLEQDK